MFTIRTFAYYSAISILYIKIVSEYYQEIPKSQIAD